MRLKQRPIKTSRHKSVTFSHDTPHTSFGDSSDRQHDATDLNRHSEIIDYSYDHEHQDAFDTNDTLNLKQYQNVRHMSDVMRLAFLENNAISPEVWANIDFNLSAATILQRNIQQQLEWNATANQVSTPKNIRQPPSQQSQQPKQPKQLAHNTHNTHNAHNHQSIPFAYNLTHNQQSSRKSNTTHNNSNHRIANSQQHQQQQQQQQQQQHSKVSRISNQHSAVITAPTSVIKQESGVGEFPCDEPGCGKFFPTLRKLRHHKVVHSNDFPFTCQFEGCEKKFKRKFGIDLHSTTHFDLDPEMYARTSNTSSMEIFGRRIQYSMCKQCDVKFKTVHEYQVHMLGHGKEPFKCLVKGCGQSFSIWKSFQKHRASHYFNYYCRMSPDCEHHTSNLQLLKLHIYCCHFSRKLPENAKPASRDHEPAAPTVEDNDAGGDCASGSGTGELDNEDVGLEMDEDQDDEFDHVNEQQDEPHMDDHDDDDDDRHHFDELEQQEESISDTAGLSLMENNNISDYDSPISEISRRDAELLFLLNITPRRDPRLRRNPPRSVSYNDFPFEYNISPSRKSSQNSSTNNNSRAYSQQQQQNTRALRSRLSSATSTPSSTIHHQEGGVNEFPCDEPGCGKFFPSLRKLRHHKVVHSNEFPYICQFEGCEKKFKRKFGIDLHSTTHFDLDEEMYKRTTNSNSMRIFGRRIQYSMCKQCDVKFKTVHEYQVHMVAHGKEPFKCPVKGCGQSFSIWKSFQKHRASHYFNYYCRMSPDCEHHTSNLQLLKLHIYCCHFSRKLPENAKPASRDHEPAAPTVEGDCASDGAEEDLDDEDGVGLEIDEDHDETHNMNE